MGLNKTVELIDVESIVDVAFESHDVVDSAVLVPVVNFALQPAVVRENLKALFTPQEPRYKNIHLIRLHYRWRSTRRTWSLTVVGIHPVFTLIVLIEFLLLNLLALHIDQALNILRVE